MNCYAKLLFFKRGGYEIGNGKIFVNIDKVVSCAKEMLKEIIRIQIDIDFEKGWNEFNCRKIKKFLLV